MIKYSINKPVCIPSKVSNQGTWGFPQVKLTQSELTEFVKTIPYKAGDYITLATAMVGSMQQIAHVLKIEDKFEKIIYRYQSSTPMCLHLISCYLDNTTAWVRHDEVKGYRKLTDQEYNDFIKPNHDHLQNSIDKWKTPNIFQNSES